MSILLRVSLVALIGLHAGRVDAQCSFDAVGTAKGVRSSMVRSQSPTCGSTGGVFYNTMTEGGIPACSPVAPPASNGGSGTSYAFSDKGGCSFQTRSAVEPDCALLENADGSSLGLPAGPCHVTHVRTKCKGILRADGLSPIHGEEDGGWSFFMLVRLSINDAIGGDMTIVDLPMHFAFPNPNNGGLSLVGDSAEALTGIIGPASAALPTCSQMKILAVTIKDPDGQRFAEIGMGTR